MIADDPVALAASIILGLAGLMVAWGLVGMLIWRAGERRPSHFDEWGRPAPDRTVDRHRAFKRRRW